MAARVAVRDTRIKVHVGQKWRRKYTNYVEDGVVYKLVTDSDRIVSQALLAVDGKQHVLTLSLDLDNSRRINKDYGHLDCWEWLDENVPVVEPVLISPKLEVGQLWRRHYTNCDPRDHEVIRIEPHGEDGKGHAAAVLKCTDKRFYLDEYILLDDEGFCTKTCREYWSPCPN